MIGQTNMLSSPIITIIRNTRTPRVIARHRHRRVRRTFQKAPTLTPLNNAEEESFPSWLERLLIIKIATRIDVFLFLDYTTLRTTSQLVKKMCSHLNKFNYFKVNLVHYLVQNYHHR
jgi:hypothetical protein